MQELPLPRCLCIHSSLQLVDLTMSSLMLHHGLLPAPLDHLPQPVPSGLVKTVLSIERIRNELRSAFRSRHRYAIKEVVFSIGQTPLRPVRSYSLPVDICESWDSSNSDCGDPCGELTPEDTRKVNRFLFQYFPPESPKAIGLRLFVYLRASDILLTENIEESDPCKPGSSVSVKFSTSKCSHAIADTTTSLTWLRLVPFVVQGKTD